MTTEWLDIPGCRGFQANSAAEILNIRKNRIVRQRPAASGAIQVHIGKSTRMVHDLVARAFYGHPLARGYRVKHLNGILSDNRPDNLVWSGSPVLNSQPPVLPHELEQEYDQARDERLALIDLMQN